MKEIDQDNVLQEILAASPELQAAQENVYRARVALQRARVEPIPNVFVQIGAQYDYSSDFAVAGLQVGVPLPVFNANQGNIRSAEAEVIAAEREVDRIRLELEHRLAATMERYANARYEVERSSKFILRDTKEALDLVTEGYGKGQLRYLRFLTAQRAYFQANIQYLSALRNWWAAKLEIDGLLLSGGLSSIRTQVSR